MEIFSGMRHGAIVVDAIPRRSGCSGRGRVDAAIETEKSVSDVGRGIEGRIEGVIGDGVVKRGNIVISHPWLWSGEEGRKRKRATWEML